MTRILHLTIKKKWFDQIKTGEKVREFRKIKPYWTARIKGKQFDEIHFRNGYRPDSPLMRVEWHGTGKMMLEGGQHYVLHLGKILELRE